MGIPVASAAWRWDTPASRSAVAMASATARDCCSGASIWSTVVPKWTHGNTSNLVNFWRLGYLRCPNWLRAAGISRSAYLRLEDGSRVADTLQLARLCGVYRMPLSRFFHLAEDRLATMRADLDLD